MNVSGKSVLITGASRGLGRALALELAAQGARIGLVARPSEDLKSLEALIRSKGGVAFALPADVSDKNAVYPVVAQASELVGPIDVLINNASTLGPVPLELLADTDCEELERTLLTNLVGPFRLTKAVIGSMIVRRGGLVINISSDAAVSAYPRWGAYSASKAGLDHLTKVWAEELRETAVKLVSLDPGEMNTKMHADAMPDEDPAQLARPEDVAARIGRMIRGLETVATGSRLLVQQWSAKP